MPKAEQDYPLIYARDRAEWRAWLEANHASVRGIYLVISKKGASQPSVSYVEAVEEALCFGWIDSRTNSIDAERFRQVFTPRGPKSTWSKVNKERVARLIAAGQMAPAGLAEIERAKASGAWTAQDKLNDLVVPPDLQAALEANPTAARNFAGFSNSSKRMFLARVEDAKRPETRQKRVAEMVSLAEQGLTPYTWNQAQRKKE